MNPIQKSWIEAGQTALGIEFGSTRIKAVLIGPDHSVLAVGSHNWENQLVDGVWTYSMEAVWAGLQDAYAAAERIQFEKKYMRHDIGQRALKTMEGK